jgi:hypothetical protein
MADALTSRGDYELFREEPEHCAGSLLATVEALWKARTEIHKLKARAMGITLEAYEQRLVDAAMAQAKEQ